MSDLYFCPTAGEIESDTHCGLKGRTCCAHPELHAYLGYATPGIEAISQWLSDKVREEYRGPLVHPGQQDPTTIKWVSDAAEAKQELLRLQKVARHYRDVHQHLASHRWAETVHTEDDGLLHVPVYAADGTEAEGLVMDRNAATVLQAMLTSYIGECTSPCDDDCDVACHEAHAVPWKRHHPIGEHPSRGTALDYVTQAVARFDMDHMLSPEEPLPDPAHDFWALWRATARNAITAYNGYIEHTGHRYLSTGCRHGEHGYCQSNTGSQGQKRPAECKFCGSGCVCSCHTPGAITVVERIVNHAATGSVLGTSEPSMEDLCTGTSEAMCGAEPPLRADHPDTQWGDCWCTLLPDHEGDHSCEPCTKRHGAPPWPQTPKEKTP